MVGLCTRRRHTEQGDPRGSRIHSKARKGGTAATNNPPKARLACVTQLQGVGGCWRLEGTGKTDPHPRQEGVRAEAHGIVVGLIAGGGDGPAVDRSGGSPCTDAEACKGCRVAYSPPKARGTWRIGNAEGVPAIQGRVEGNRCT